jgi:hypothetical protein
LEKKVKNSLLACLVILLCAAVSPVPAEAGNAGLLLSPTRIVLENGARYVTVIARNTGDATGRYKVELVDAEMSENGGIHVLEDGKHDEFSLIGMLSISPSNMTLKPDETQSVRILVKKKEGIADGEYRSHLQVRMTESDIDPATDKPNEGTGIAIHSKITTIIPVIVRFGQTNFNLTMDDAELMTGGGENQQVPEVKLSMSFSGNRSIIGDIKVTHIAPDGKETTLAFVQGIPIYRGVAKRTQAVSLNDTDKVNLHSGRLRVDFLSQENEGSHVLAEKEITL